MPFNLSYREIDDKTFINEMRMLWQNTLQRKTLGNIIRKYFGEERSEPIINKLQEKI